MIDKNDSRYKERLARAEKWAREIEGSEEESAEESDTSVTDERIRDHKGLGEPGKAQVSSSQEPLDSEGEETEDPATVTTSAQTHQRTISTKPPTLPIKSPLAEHKELESGQLATASTSQRHDYTDSVHLNDQPGGFTADMKADDSFSIITITGRLNEDQRKDVVERFAGALVDELLKHIDLNVGTNSSRASCRKVISEAVAKFALSIKVNVHTNDDKLGVKVVFRLNEEISTKCDKHSFEILNPLEEYGRTPVFTEGEPEIGSLEKVDGWTTLLSPLERSEQEQHSNVTSLRSFSAVHSASNLDMLPGIQITIRNLYRGSTNPELTGSHLTENAAFRGLTDPFKNVLELYHSEKRA
ncbi:uncharacterized protein JN550_012324 [Neoarthrinium moseri]|uniref:uncharacterized protein n=1 Tax=Neoarthrinium moseri TaxID=1658444 RepID=UPI001FDC2D69|nr:uncharacterized protein JN550_012324 [Neoarthrinium moseri]KAI1858865.1 hypothetical protein JN550_012324 [Neoarthrinium moseri]